MDFTNTDKYILSRENTMNNMNTYFVEVAVGFTDYTWTTAIKKVVCLTPLSAENIAEDGVRMEYEKDKKEVTFVKALWHSEWRTEQPRTKTHKI